MKSESIHTQPRLALLIHRSFWTIAVLLLLTLAGCLTTYAAGPTEQKLAFTPTLSLSPPTDTPTASPTAVRGVTLVPNPAVYAFQTLTPTATATATPTATPTPEPTNTPQATNTPAPTATATPIPTNTPRPTAIPATVAPFQAYAWLDSYYPQPGSVVTAYGMLFKDGRPVNGAQMGVTWSYTHGKAYCTAYTGIDGRAACTQNIGAPLQDYWVYVDVVFVFEDVLYYAKTAFLPDP